MLGFYSIVCRKREKERERERERERENFVRIVLVK